MLQPREHAFFFVGVCVLLNATLKKFGEFNQLHFSVSFRRT